MKRKFPVSLIVVSIFVVIITAIVLYCSANSHSLLLRINWGIYLPEPKEVETVFTYDGRDGEEFEIWRYAASFSPKEKMESVTAGSIYHARLAFENFRDDLSYDNERLRLFDQNFVEQIKEGDYWKKVTDSTKPNCYLLLYYDVSHHLLYYITWFI